MHIASNNAVWVICFVLNFILFLPFLFFYNQLKYNEFTQKSKLYEAINYHNNISVFAVSTYNTDYVLVKKENYQNALEILEKNGYEIVE